MTAATPTATYRLQLHAGFTFDDVASAVPYLADLGVSHVYCSPVLQAMPGSRHGYDVIDHDHLGVDLGGEDGWQRLLSACRQHGLGIVVDVVPNHMAASPLSAAWHDVLRHGRRSAHARWFDIDWDAQGGKVLLPVLGRPLNDCLHDGELTVQDDELRYFDLRFPLAAGTADLPLAESIDAQHYRLAYWRTAIEELNYRRFFDISDLAALRVEDEQVFDATHRLLLEKVRLGEIDGLRIDHPDGLADPRGYLHRLRDASGACWVVVEKILEAGERLPPDWACAGTTGYDALARVSGVLTDPSGAQPLTALYTQLTGAPAEFEPIAVAAKREAIRDTLSAEMRHLCRLAAAEARARRADFSERGLVEGLAALLGSLSVYRAYVAPDEVPSEESVELLAAGAERARRALPSRDREIDWLARLALRGPAEFVVRFQQTSGPVMAKGIEDTAFYRYHRLAALCEVGSDPGAFGYSLDSFHRANVQAPAAGMTTLSTHDTKRSEDVRARLLVLAEVPIRWGETVTSWRVRHHLAADPNIEYLLWQTLVGGWPIERDRIHRYAEKAAREAKQHTTWTDPDPAYEKELHGFVDGLYDDRELLEQVGRFVADVLEPAATSNVLTQKLVQLAMPGVPDVYQGSERTFLALVDPDNRRPVSFAPTPQDRKWQLTRAILRLRREHQDWFGDYLPLQAGEHLLGFLRGERIAVVGTRFPERLRREGGWRDTEVSLPIGRWRDALTGREHAGGPVRVGDALAELPVALLIRS